MKISPHFPYRSEAARDLCFEYLESLAARDWPIPSEVRTIQTTFGPTFVRVSGTTGDPPVVLLHGAGATSLMWTPNIEALSAGYRTFAIDQVNDFGRTVCTQRVRRMNDLVMWLNEVFDGLDLKAGVHLVGMSYGGALAAQYAVRFPARLNKTVLLAPGNTVLHARAEFAVRLTASVAFRRYLRPLMLWMFPDMVRQDPKWFEAKLELLFTNVRNVRRRWIPIPPVLTDEQWRDLGVPTLFLVGEHEVMYPAGKAVERLQSVAPGVIAEIVPGAGHDLTFVQAAMVNRRIAEFLKAD
ncbi:MAG: alpha/beta hydrolase [Bryobacteraceae bacterium]